MLKLNIPNKKLQIRAGSEKYLYFLVLSVIPVTKIKFVHAIAPFDEIL
jgi:hypothetical protein